MESAFRPELFSVALPSSSGTEAAVSRIKCDDVWWSVVFDTGWRLGTKRKGTEHNQDRFLLQRPVVHGFPDGPITGKTRVRGVILETPPTKGCKTLRNV